MSFLMRHRRIPAWLAGIGAIVAACAAAAQTAPAAIQPVGSIVSLGSAPLTGVAIGDGVHQSQPLVNTFQGSQTPLVGVGALSGHPGHDGSVVSISVLNSTRLLGVSAGPIGSNGVNIANPTGKPVLSGLAK